MLSKKTTVNQYGASRRNFLAKLGIGVAAVAGVSAGLVKFGGANSTKTEEFPGPGSIFHPAQDPRQDPRRRG